jgi:hypothetical protein
VRRVVILRSGAASNEVVFELRTELANACLEMAAKCGEPRIDGLKDQ